MAKKSATKGGLLFGDSHSDPSGGINTINVDTNERLLVEGGEVVINKEAVKKHWKELNEINTSTGGRPIDKPIGAVGKKGGKVKKQSIKKTKELLIDYIGKHSFEEFFRALKSSSFGAFPIDYPNTIELIGLVPNADKLNEIRAKTFYINNRVLAKAKRDKLKKEATTARVEQIIENAMKHTTTTPDINNEDLLSAKENVGEQTTTEEMPIVEYDINIGDEGMWHGGNRRVKQFDDLGNVYIVELDENNNEVGDIVSVSLESFKKEFSKFPAVSTSFSVPVYKKGDKVAIFDNELALEVIEVNEWADKLPTYDLRSEDGSIVRNNISETKLSLYENKVSEALIKHDKMVATAKKQERLMNIGEENVYEASKYLRDLIDEQVAIYEDNKKNKYAKDEIGKLLSIYFNEIVAKNPELLFDFLKDQKRVPATIKVMAQYAVDPESSETFKSNLKYNIWKAIPEEYKEYSLPKRVNYSPLPDDKNLASILTPFTSSDTLRLNLMGVRFDKEGIAATDAHKMVFLAHPDEERDVKTYCIDKDCLKENAIATIDKKRENIDEFRYPHYRAVVPDNKNYISIYTESLIAYLSTVIKIKYFNSVVRQAFVMFDSEQEFAFNSMFLLEAAKTMYKLGYEQIDISYSLPGRAIVMCPKGKVRDVHKMQTDFILVMPIMMFHGDIVDLTDGVMFFNAESECVQTKGIEDKSCLNPLVVHHNKIDEKLKKIDAFETKEKERESQRIADEAKKLADIVIPEPEPLIDAEPVAEVIEQPAVVAVDEKEEWKDALATLQFIIRNEEGEINPEWIEAIEILELLLGDDISEYDKSYEKKYTELFKSTKSPKDFNKKLAAWVKANAPKSMADGGAVSGFDDEKYSGLLYKYNDLYEKHELTPSVELKNELDITQAEIHKMERAGDYDKEIMESQFGK